MFKLNILDGQYYIDIDSCLNFVSNVGSNERLSNSVITSTYSEDPQMSDDEMTIVTKEIVESKGNGGGNDFFHHVRYEMVKWLINSLTNYYSNEGVFLSYEDNGELTLAQKLAFNTLVKYGIIVKVEKKYGEK